jgi:hypothetical protein
LLEISKTHVVRYNFSNKFLTWFDKTNAMKHNYFFNRIVILLAILGVSNLQAQVTTFAYTGAVQTYTVPPGVTSIQLETWGAEGGTGTYSGITPTAGLGGYAIGNLTVIPGQVLNVYVGGRGFSSGAGGYNGGGMAGTSYGAAGGGASDVRISPYGLSNRVIVGGGGGGAAFGSSPNDGGNGGGLVASPGETGGGFTGGGGGTQVAGGAAGCCYGAATSGTFGIGGGPGDYHNAGGGGGWYGGGSGAGQAGAGGGSSYIGGVASGVTTPGLRAGNGQVVITVLCSPMTLVVSDYEICLGESVTMGADGAGTITWDGGVLNGVPYTPASAGTFTYTATSSSPLDCGLTVEVLVNELPNVTASVDETEICLGESVIFSNSGADTYSWDPADVTAGDPYSPTEGTATYVVTGVNTSTGCENTAEVEVTVFGLPNVVANIDDEEICLGQEITLEGSGAESYTWDPATVEDGVAFAPDATGTFTFEVTGTDANGCENTATTSVTVYDELTITYTTVDEMAGADGEIDITVTGGNPAYSFDWDNDGTGDFDDTEDLTGLAGGTYIVVVQDEAGCSINESIVVNSQLGVTTNALSTLSIYPNPVRDNLTITQEGNFVYQLVTLEGKVLVNGTALNQKVIDMNEFAKGVYLLNITVNGQEVSTKVVVE